MKAIVFSGDSGTKLYPLTLGIPKQLIPVYDKPMVYYPIELLVNTGFKNILTITPTKDQRLFQKLLDGGDNFGASLSYTIQEAPEGIDQAISIR